MKHNRMNRRQFVTASVSGAISTTLAGSHQGVKLKQSEPKRMPSAGWIVRSDMSQSGPPAAFSRTFEKDRWQLIDYETEEGIKGTMASAFPEHRCCELSLPLHATGPHKIYLGINYTKIHYDEYSPYGLLEVKLTGDPGFRRVTAEFGTMLADGSPKLGVNNFNYKSIQEAYWKTAVLTGESLIFRQPEYPYNRPEHANITNLAYVKLVPLNEDESRQWKESIPTDETRRLAIIFCTGQFTGHTSGSYTFHPTSQEWFKNEFVPYAGSDIKILIFEAMRGNYCLFRTKIGDVGTEDNRWRQEWRDPLAEFTRLAHDNGMKIFASMRMIGPQYPMNRAPIGWARHYWRHREWTKLDRDGVPLTNLSLAFPGVRQYWLSLLREALAYGIDGIQLHLNRANPFVFFEEPVVRSFQTKYGTDPRGLPENDHRWHQHCAGFVTQFVREVRSLLDERPGRELGTTIYGEPHKYDKDKTPYHPIRYCCDVETWLREGLVNYVMPSPSIKTELLQKWRGLAGDRVHLWPDLMPRTQLPENYARLAGKYYEAGADGLCLWDGERRPAHISEWAAVQQLGHKDLLGRLARQAPSYYRRIPLKYLAGFSVQESFHDG
jgi:Glycosyl hydrolase-like 10